MSGAEEDHDDTQQGRWSSEEHKLFLEGINRFGREWDKVQAVVRTRSLAQIRSHAQKYFMKLSKHEELERLHDAEYWKLSGRSFHEQYSAMVVLDLMSNILHQLKKRRKELEEDGSTSNSDVKSESCTDDRNNNKKCRLEDLDDVHNDSISDNTMGDIAESAPSSSLHDNTRSSVAVSLLSMGSALKPIVEEIEESPQDT